MPSESLTTAAAAQRRLQELDLRMNELQNAALGRGTQPLVSEKLANVVSLTWQEYRRWRDALGGVTLVWSYLSELENWTKRANKLGAAISAEGVATPPPLQEWEQVGPSSVIQGFGMLAAGFGLVWLLSNRRR